MNLRRQLLALLAAAPLLPSRTVGQANTLKPTPQDALGPFYPPRWTGEIDNDLTTFAGKNFERGVPLALTGRVLTIDGKPLSGVTIDIWHTDDRGKYRHPSDDGEGPAQRGFQGFGRTQTDAEGRYAFRTIKPALYGGRPPHVHFKVVASGHQELITQMYFSGDNTERGFNFGFSKERDRLTVTPTASRDGTREALSARFDLVLVRSG